MFRATSLFALRKLRLAALAALAVTGITAPALAQDEARPGFSFDPFARAEIGVVFSQSEDRDEELLINGDGGYFRLQAGTEFGNDDTVLRVEADRIFVERFGSATGRDSYDRDRLTVSVTQKLGDDFEIEAQGRIYDDLVSVESSDTDEVQGSLEVIYEPERAHRVRVRGTWRERNYDDGEGPLGASSEGEGPRVDAQYRHRFDRYHYLTFDLRAEEITSDNPFRNYTRESAGVSYTHPLSRDVRVRPAVDVRHTRFDGRITPSGEVREDTAVVPEVELLWWPGNWRVEAEAKYVITDSNDPVRDREGYRFSLSVGFVF